MPRGRGWLARLVLVVVGASLAWQVVVRTWSAYLSTTAPDLALALNGAQPQALNLAAEQRLDQLINAARSKYAETSRDRLTTFASKPLLGIPSDHDFSDLPADFVLAPEDARNLRRLLHRSLAAEPINSRALALLGRIAELVRDDATAADYYTRAVTQSRHESSAAVFLLNHHLRLSQYPDVVKYADILLRTRRALLAPIAPVLARVAETEAGQPFVTAVLVADPPWRRRFMQLLPRSISNARTPMLLFVALRLAGLEVSTDELAPYLELLLQNGLAELAQYTWLQFLNDEQLASLGRLNNSSFELPPSGLPFDWSFRAGTNATAEIRTHPTNPDRRILAIEFQGGRAEFKGGVRQWLVLAPGSYRLTGSVEGDLRGRRGLRWRVFCGANRAAPQIGQSDMLLGKISEDQSFSMDFVVPDQSCPGQVLQLDLDARSSSEQMASGTLLFDTLVISRQDAPALPREAEIPEPSAARSLIRP